MEGYFYRAYGLVFQSELRLPELAEVAAAPADVHIRRGELPRPEGEFPEGWYQAGRRCHMHAWPEVGVFRVEGGSEIVVEPAPRAAGELVRHVLLGAIMGPLLLQRGMLPLHAAALEIGGVAFAFSAVSGEGKSTLAATLQARGHRFLSDDVLGIPWQRADEIRVSPAVPRLKLLPDAARELGYDRNELTPVYDGLDKSALSVPPVAADAAPVPLRGIFLLETAEQIAVMPLDPRVAVLHLMGHTFKPDVVARTIGAGEHMKACATLAAKAGVFRLQRPRDLSRLDEVADRVLDECRRLAR